MRWPLAIATGLGLMVAVNLVFIYVAVSGADPVSADWLEQDNRQ